MKDGHSEVILAGVGQTPVGEFWDLSLRTLAARAILAAIKDSGNIKPQVMYIGNMLAPSASQQANLGALLPDNVGLTGLEGVTVEAADASGGAALRAAYLAVRSGAVESALAVGVEKYTDVIGPESEAMLSQMLDADFEAAQGLTPLSLAGLLFHRYLVEYQAEHEAFAGFPEVAHANGATNPNAMFQRAMRDGAYERAATAAEILNLFDVAPYADGAAAVLLTCEDALPEAWDKPRVRLIGSSSVVDTISIHDRHAPLVWDAARLSIERACRTAGIMPKDVDFFEYHDATSLHAVLSLEAAGFASQGQGWMLAKPEVIGLNGQIPVATFGGLKARGHPIGATGVYQAVEATLQLRGEAGPNQVPGAKLGLIQNLGGMAATAVTHVLAV
ncbi:MAG: beta-ketoacyl synthase N-terminal-like domain-containing protein [Brevefilum sp.]|nr:beta-ketoacyl synthase N-terminal-like domain-containing protein [Brevefilum sp.]MDW7755648.1 beta-ketoacyl synthase N-terminal-like domain-containing protein [Brevefilum sp.]